MSDKAFNDPKLAINKVYTKTGDRGKTALVGGQRVPKDHPRIEAYGTVDELNAFLGAARFSISEIEQPPSDLVWLGQVLIRIQHELFNLGSILATLPQDVHPKQPQVTDAEIKQLEADIDRCNGVLPPLRSFVLPGGTRMNCDLHACRTICRRAERLLISMYRAEEVSQQSVTYINRLSDAFFVFSRFVNVVSEQDETLWEPNKGASGTR